MAFFLLFFFFFRNCQYIFDFCIKIILILGFKLQVHAPILCVNGNVIRINARYKEIYFRNFVLKRLLLKIPGATDQALIVEHDGVW